MNIMKNINCIEIIIKSYLTYLPTTYDAKILLFYQNILGSSTLKTRYPMDSTTLRPSRTTSPVDTNEGKCYIYIT